MNTHARTDEKGPDSGASAIPLPDSSGDASYLLDIDFLMKRLTGRATIPDVRSFREYLAKCARVPLRNGAYGPFEFTGREPLNFIVDLIDSILSNTFAPGVFAATPKGGVQGELTALPIDSRPACPNTSNGPAGSELPSSDSPLETQDSGPAFPGVTITVGGGAQWGKTVLALNLQAYLTFVRFVNFGYYTADLDLLGKIVDGKFRPDVLDQQPWMSRMIRLGIHRNASGKMVHRQNSYGVSDPTGAGRRAFGHFCGMHKPPTTISLDAAVLDEVDDIPAGNMGYVDGRMTGSPLRLKLEIGTQRIAGAGQNARLKAGSFHVRMVPCPHCATEWNLEENFPRIIRAGRASSLPGAKVNYAPQERGGTTAISSPLPSDGIFPSPAGAGEGGRPVRHNLGEGGSPGEGCAVGSNIRGERPGEVRVPSSLTTQNTEPKTQNSVPITPEMGFDPAARYFISCPECATELDRDAGRWLARNPDRIREGHFSIRVSQLNISAISVREIVGAWYAAMADASGEALAAFHCDRIAIPNAGAAQPITQAVLDRARSVDSVTVAGTVERGAATLHAPDAPRSSIPVPNAPRSPISAPHAPRSPIPAPNAPRSPIPAPDAPRSPISAPHAPRSPRFAGLDMGPRCWFWSDEVRDELTTACIWAEMIASGSAMERVPFLMRSLGISCIFLDAGGEPDLTKRLVLSLNGLEHFTPPPLPRAELLKAQFSYHNPRPNTQNSKLKTQNSKLSWDGTRGKWRGLRAAAVLFVPGGGRGIEQTIGFTQDGRIYPLIKCNRSESIQAAVNDFLTPAEGILEMVRNSELRTQNSKLREAPRALLPKTYPGNRVSQAVLDGHLLNLRKERNPRTGIEDWIDGVENHLGLAKVYARLAATVAEGSRHSRFFFERVRRRPRARSQTETHNFEINTSQNPKPGPF